MIVSADDPVVLGELAQYLGEVEELRGRVRKRLRSPGPQDMGPVLEALEIVVGPAGLTAATATAIIAWVRSRRAAVRVTVRHSTDGARTVELDARGLTALDADGLRQLTTSILETADPGEPDRALPAP